MDWKSAQEFYSTVGLPSLMVLASGWAVWKFALFVGPIFRNVATSHVDLMTSLKANLQTQTETGEHTKKQLAGLHDKVDALKELAIRRRCHAAPDSDLFDKTAGSGSGIHK